MLCELSHVVKIELYLTRVSKKVIFSYTEVKRSFRGKEQKSFASTCWILNLPSYR